VPTDVRKGAAAARGSHQSHTRRYCIRVSVWMFRRVFGLLMKSPVVTRSHIIIITSTLQCVGINGVHVMHRDFYDIAPILFTCIVIILVGI